MVSMDLELCNDILSSGVVPWVVEETLGDFNGIL